MPPPSSSGPSSSGGPSSGYGGPSQPSYGGPPQPSYGGPSGPSSGGFGRGPPMMPPPSSGPGPSPYPSSGSGPSPYPSSGSGPSPYPSSGPGPSPYSSSGSGPSPYPSSGSGLSPYPSSGPGPSPYSSSGSGPSPYPSSGSGPSPYLSSGPGPSPYPSSGGYGAPRGPPVMQPPPSNNNISPGFGGGGGGFGSGGGGGGSFQPSPGPSRGPSFGPGPSSSGPYSGGPSSSGPSLTSPDGGRTYQHNAPSKPEPTPLVVIDDSLQADTHFIRTTVGAVPSTANLKQQCGITLGAMLRPLAEPSGDGITPVVNFGACGVVRCKRCRTYINPFVDFTDNGRRWKCNLCGMVNDVASQYFSHLESNGKRADLSSRPELQKGQVEFIAPAEYMVRPPQAPVYFFVIDVSYASVASGMLQVLTDTVKDSLDKLAGSSRTQVGFITFDTSVHFYNLKSTLKTPQMLVVPDLVDLHLPSPDDLLVNLADSRKVIDVFLDSLPRMFSNTRDVDTSFGSALNATFKVMGAIGGKMLVFQSGLPSMGPGALKHRENPKVLGISEWRPRVSVEGELH